MEYKVLKKERVYDGFFKLDRYTLEHDLFAGGKSKAYSREILNRGDAVAVLIYDPELDSLLVIKQFRVGAIESGKPWVYELVAGVIDQGEAAEDVAIREAQEEAGVEIRNLKKINTHFNSVGGCSETTTLYYAEADLSEAGGAHGLDCENEDIQSEVISRTDFQDRLTHGVFNTSSILMAGWWASSNL